MQKQRVRNKSIGRKEQEEKEGGERGNADIGVVGELRVLAKSTC